MSVRGKKDPIADSLARVLRNLGSDKSRRAYADDWARYIEWLKTEGVTAIEAKPRHVEDHIAHLQELGNQRPTCGRALSVIRSVYGILVRDEVVVVNPAREVKNPKFDSTPNTPHLSEEQVQQIFSLPAETWKERRERVCLSLLFGIAWRREEIAAIRNEDFVRTETVIVNGVEVAGTLKSSIIKGGKRLIVGVPLWVREEIDDWAEFAGITEGPLLPRSPKKPAAVSGDIVYQIVKDAVVRAGLPKGCVSPHGLRRTNITLGGKRGISLKDRQLAVGHASQGTTERYDKANDAAKNAPGQVFADLVGHKVEDSK